MNVWHCHRAWQTLPQIGFVKMNSSTLRWALQGPQAQIVILLSGERDSLLFGINVSPVP